MLSAINTMSVMLEQDLERRGLVSSGRSNVAGKSNCVSYVS